MTDFRTFCDLFYSAHYLPIAYFKNDKCIYSIGFPASYIALEPIYHTLLTSTKFPAIYTAGETGYYGMLALPSNHGYLLLGPIFSTPITKKILQEFMHENSLAKEIENELYQFLSSLPIQTYYHFMNLMAYLHYTLNQEIIQVEEHFGISERKFQDEIASTQVETAFLEREEQITHGTYLFEQQMLEFVRRGNATGLKEHLLSFVKTESFHEGTVGESPLRQAKNLFLGTVAMVGKSGAIPGGLDIEQTYHLIDAYSRECEHLQSVESITALQYNMLMDFANRVAQVQIPEGVSPEIFSCIQYINMHINEPISVQDIADLLGMSRAYTIKRFKEELGFNIGEYITHARIQEAKSLLKYTNKSLSEISNYLCYSSQAYFQNVFKKVVGCTPLEYRKDIAHSYQPKKI